MNPASVGATTRKVERSATHTRFPLVVGAEPLSVGDIVSVARHGRPAVVSTDAAFRARMAASRRLLDDAVSRGDAIYGVTTRFGGMADDVLPASEAACLQERALWMHATAVGDRRSPDHPFSTENTP